MAESRQKIPQRSRVPVVNKSAVNERGALLLAIHPGVSCCRSISEKTRTWIAKLGEEVKSKLLQKRRRVWRQIRTAL